MNPKFSLTSETISHCGITLYRIKAEKDFEGIKKGTLGGFVEKEENLSADGNAYVFGSARVFGSALVSGDAQVSGNAQVSGDAQVYGNAWVYGNARVYGNALVYGDAQVSGNAQVSGDAQVYGDAEVYGNARVYGNALVYGDARVSGKIKLEFGYCFAWKSKHWNVTEVENGDDILLIEDYAPATEEKEVEEFTMEQVCKLLGREIKIKS